MRIRFTVEVNYIYRALNIILKFQMEATNNNIAASGEEGLDELLDSCLDDFNRPLPKSAPSNPEASSSTTSKADVKDANTDGKFPESLNWGEEFKQFQDVMENFLENESEVNELKNLMSNLNENAVDQTFLDAIKDLTDGAQNIPDMSPDMLDDLFKNMDLNDPNRTNPEQLPEIMPLMHTIMQNLMSKELLYPSLKDIVEKYPNWLDKNKPSLKSQDYERYDQQFKLMKSVCDEFEKECEDTEEAKKVQFEKVLSLMQKIQNYGNPPKELIADLEHSAPLDEHGNLQIPGMPQQCSIM